MIGLSTSKLTHFIKEKLDEEMLHVSYVKSVDQLADILTKGVSTVVFSEICSKMGLIDIFAPS
jgi:predicted house-cleaning noncanonical NTP pyrophosphatase (MazG superfamily)